MVYIAQIITQLFSSWIKKSDDKFPVHATVCFGVETHLKVEPHFVRKRHRWESYSGVFCHVSLVVFNQINYRRLIFFLTEACGNRFVDITTVRVSSSVPYLVFLKDSREKWYLAGDVALMDVALSHSWTQNTFTYAHEHLAEEGGILQPQPQFSHIYESPSTKQKAIQTNNPARWKRKCVWTLQRNEPKGQEKCCHELYNPI